MGKLRFVSRQASRCQQAFTKSCLVNLISKDTHLVFSMYTYTLIRKVGHIEHSIPYSDIYNIKCIMNKGCFCGHLGPVLQCLLKVKQYLSKALIFQHAILNAKYIAWIDVAVMVKDIIMIFRKIKTILIVISFKRYFSHPKKSILNLSLP